MSKKVISLALMVLLCFSLFGVPAGADNPDIIYTNLGTDAPSGMLDGNYLLPLFDDGYDELEDITVIPTLLGDITTDVEVTTLNVGSYWTGSWSHGYAGRVYFSENEVTLTMPNKVKSFVLYVAPNIHETVDVTVKANDGQEFVQSIDSSAADAASGFGFTATGSSYIETITISTLSDENGFAFGDLYIGIDPADLGIAENSFPIVKDYTGEDQSQAFIDELTTILEVLYNSLFDLMGFGELGLSFDVNVEVLQNGNPVQAIEPGSYDARVNISVEGEAISEEVLLEGVFVIEGESVPPVTAPPVTNPPTGQEVALLPTILSIGILSAVVLIMSKKKKATAA